MNYQEILKACKGLYVHSPYAMIWGRKISGDGKIYEITDVPPLTFISNGLELLDYRISGNTVQNGEPTPENPVEVVGCGERTENLINFEESIQGIAVNNNNVIINNINFNLLYTNVSGLQKVSLSGCTPNSAINLVWYDNEKNILSTAGTKRNGTYSVPDDAIYMGISITNANSSSPDYNRIMLTPGTTAPDHYIPYGYKIPITVTNKTETVTTPVYIGSEPLHKIGDYADYAVRKSDGTKKRFNRIEKLVLTVEALKKYKISSMVNYNTEDLTTIGINTDLQVMPNRASKCTHFWQLNSPQTATFECHGFHRQEVYGNWIYFRIKFSTIGTNPESSTDENIQGFKKFLTNQYEAGTPVTVWYVLAEPEEEQLDLSRIQTVKGTNILTVDTEVQPSEMYIKYQK